MATGPEHYREAEWLLRKYDQIADAGGDPGDMLAGAQVHATLALAAATAMQATVDECAVGMTVEEREAWYAAAGTKPSGGDAG